MKRQFARIYYDDLQVEFPEVWADDSMLATWTRLLVLAEKMWPAIPEIPRSVRIKTFEKLVATGLVIPHPSHCYRIRGLDAERTRRQDSARSAAALRWESERNAPALAPAMPSRAETRRAEIEANRPDLEAFLLVRRKAPTPKQRQLLDDILDRRDVTGAQWAADIILSHPDDPIGAVIEADRTWRDERIAEARNAERKSTENKRKPLPSAARELLQEWGRAKDPTA